MAKQNRIIDTHSHILPGIDDGAKTFTDSIDLIRELTGQGITDIIATPHFVNETVYDSTRAKNSRLLTSLKKYLAEENIEVNIYLGNEIYIDANILELIKARKISPLADSEYLLVELPLDTEFPNYEDHLNSLMEHGFKVVLAHPERYAIIQKDFQIAQNLHESGLLFQCNYGSIVGKYGKSAKKLIKKLIKNKMIFTFGSDIHHARGENYVEKAIKKLGRYYSPAELRQLLATNPSKFLK